MYHVKGYRKLGRDSAHRKAMLRNLATSFFVSGSLSSTLHRCKEVQPVVEKLITAVYKFKNTRDLQSYRKYTNYLYYYKHRPLKLIDQIMESKMDRPDGGYTTLLKLHRRKGDGAYLGYLTLNKSYFHPFSDDSSAKKSGSEDTTKQGVKHAMKHALVEKESSDPSVINLDKGDYKDVMVEDKVEDNNKLQSQVEGGDSLNVDSQKQSQQPEEKQEQTDNTLDQPQPSESSQKSSSSLEQQSSNSQLENKHDSSK